MVLENTPTLGRQLLGNLEAVTALMVQTPSSPELIQLTQMRAKLIEQIETLVESNLNRASQEYQEATRGLQTATASIQHAISGIESVITAVGTLAKALDLVAKLLPA